MSFLLEIIQCDNDSTLKDLFKKAMLCIITLNSLILLITIYIMLNQVP